MPTVGPTVPGAKGHELAPAPGLSQQPGSRESRPESFPAPLMESGLLANSASGSLQGNELAPGSRACRVPASSRVRLAANTHLGPCSACWGCGAGSHDGSPEGDVATIIEERPAVSSTRPCPCVLLLGVLVTVVTMGTRAGDRCFVGS